MSSQIDGHLQLPLSYNFNKESIHQYRKNTIDPNNFQSWLKGDMYVSSYAKHHSPVKKYIFRILLSQKLVIYLDIQDLFLRIGLKVCMEKRLLIKLNKYMQIRRLIRIDLD